MIGLKNGFVRIYPYVGQQVFSSLETYWTRGAHDSESGAVTHLVTSFDDRFAYSGGTDGNIFGYVIRGDTDNAEQQSERIPMPTIGVNRSIGKHSFQLNQ